jgi:hypothetical protein
MDRRELWYYFLLCLQRLQNTKIIKPFPRDICKLLCQHINIMPTTVKSQEEILMEEYGERTNDDYYIRQFGHLTTQASLSFRDQGAKRPGSNAKLW